MEVYMADFKDIIGHEQIIRHLKKAIHNNKVSHAYIFNGDKGTGRAILASAFAKTLQCESSDEDSCGACRSCLQTESGNHPDIKWVTHEKPATISVDDIRTQVNNDIAIKPYSSPYKIYIISDAQKMTPQAQNALLKTIEEPPGYAILLLLASDVNILLPTILSRCVILNIKAVDEEVIKKFLIKNYQLPDYKARILAAFSQGNVGKAVKMAVSEEFQAMHDDILRILTHIDTMEINEIIDVIKKIEVYKVDIDDVIDMMILWYRDVMILAATNDPNLIVFKEEYSALSKRVSKSNFTGLDTIIKGMEKAKKRLAANVNFDLTMELMLLTIKEN